MLLGVYLHSRLGSAVLFYGLRQRLLFPSSFTWGALWAVGSKVLEELDMSFVIITSREGI